MALSLKYNDLLDDGYSIKDMAEFEGVDESYILRIVKLVFLSPKIQETILLLPRSTRHRPYMSAKDLLKLVEIVGFEKQESCLVRVGNEMFTGKFIYRLGFWKG